MLTGALSRRRLLEQQLRCDQLQLLGGDCTRWPSGPADDAQQTQQWSEAKRSSLLRNGFLLSRPQYDGHHWLKAVLGNPHTSPDWLRQLAELVAICHADAAGPAVQPPWPIPDNGRVGWLWQQVLFPSRSAWSICC